MERTQHDMDMLHGPLAKKLILFTLPIALSSMLQQLFNAADTAVVGYFGNENANQYCLCRFSPNRRGRTNNGCFALD